MSEIRRVKVEIKDIESIVESCTELGMELKEVKQDLFEVKNHNLKTYGNTPVYLEKVGDVYEVRADTGKRNIDVLVSRIKKEYNQKMIIKAAKKMGYSVVSKTERNGNKVLKLRTFR